ncbi:MAG: EAL domain-containing protein [Actinomycetota bacterium]|nr:EAL domain-containing protein [Actinomycetota bacterium]
MTDQVAKEDGANSESIEINLRELEESDAIDNSPSKEYFDEPGAKRGFYVVAIGSSAGGLEALSQLLSGIERNSKLAIVILQHLSPSYKSMMAEILSRETALPVVEATSGDQIAAGRILIIPPNNNATILNGKVILTQGSNQTSPKPSINSFFVALADEYSDRAIGIVLSGTGNDGTAGLRAISDAGGQCIVQLPESAKFTGMPLSAIESGVTMKILDPQEIAQLLMALPDMIHSLDDIDDKGREAALEAILAELHEKFGVDFRGYKRGTLFRRIEHRMGLAKVDNLVDYATRVVENDEEKGELFQDILISVTSFFRDSDAFNSLSVAIERIIEQKSTGSEIRVWIPGCASGEEAYTIAMLFSEKLGARLSDIRLQLFATDIDERALSIARSGVYPAAALENLDPNLILKYFNFNGRNYEISKNLRDSIIFAKQNLAVDPPFLRLDLISCRNVLIYLDQNLQSAALSSFHFALNPAGILFLGRSESVSAQEHLFRPLDRKNRIFNKVALGLAPHTSTDTLQRHLLTKSSRRDKRSSETKRLELVLNNYLDNRKSAVLLVDSNGILLQSAGDIGRFTQVRTGVNTSNAFDLLRLELQGDFQTLLSRSTRKREESIGRRRMIDGEAFRLSVTPLAEADTTNFLVSIEFDASSRGNEERVTPEISNMVVEDELAVTRENLQAMIEELATSNEEMQALNEEAQAANEEMQAANEELEAANEELQATNEELISLNTELSLRTAQLTGVTNDYENLYNALDFPLLVLDNSMALKRFNFAAARLFNLRTIMVGTKLDLLRLPKKMLKLHSLINEARELGDSVSDLIVEESITWQANATPYLDEYGLFAGTILTLIDTSELVTAQLKRRSAELMVESLMENTTIMFVIKDVQGRYLYANRRFQQFFNNVSIIEQSTNDFDVFPSSMASQIMESDLITIRTRSARSTEYEFRTDDNESIFISATHLPLFEEDGTVNAVCVQLLDESAKRQAEEELRLAAKVFENAGEAIAVLSADGDVVTVNSAYLEVTRERLSDIVGKKFFVFDTASSSPTKRNEAESISNALREFGRWSGEEKVIATDGSKTPVWLSLSVVEDSKGRVEHILAIFSDISSNVLAREKAEFLSTHDELTSLPNRLLFKEYLNRALARKRRNGGNLALLFVDLDNFKFINDSQGHDAGDELLREVSNRIKDSVREADLVTRFGGDEFTIIVEDAENEDLDQLSDRILSLLTEKYIIGGLEQYVSASIGVAIFPHDGEDSNTLLKSADAAMYQAKKLGRNQVQFFHPQLKAEADDRSRIEHSIRRSLRANEFSVYYQPQIDIASGVIKGAEALLRHLPENTLPIDTGRLITVAETTGQIEAITNYVVSQVLDDLAEWKRLNISVPPIAINISVKNLYQKDFADWVISELDRRELGRNSIKLEITESALASDSEVALNNINALRESDITLSIDDFGTGFSSLAYLRTIPATEIKIDRSFISDAGQEGTGEAITRAIIEISRALNFEIIAEGIEEREQANWLVENGCATGQGYLFHRPMKAIDFEDLIAKGDKA